MRNFDILALTLIACAPVTLVSAAYAQWDRVERSAPRHDYAPVPDDGDYMIARVIGFGCDGAGGPLLASDEDTLPKCLAIEPIAPYAVPLAQEGSVAQ